MVAAKALLEHVGRFGTPAQIVSDNGTQFANHIVDELIKLMGTENIKILAYSKEENAIVERSNKEVMRHLRAIIFDKNIISDWKHDLPLVHRIMNASKVVSTGASPADLILGREINLDRGIFLPLQQQTGDTIPLSEWAANRLKTQAQLIKFAKSTQQKHDDEHIAQADPRRTEWEIDSYVLVEYHSSIIRKGPPDKMLTQLRGPMKVIRKSGNTYTLLNLIDNKEEQFHIKLIHPFEYDPDFTDPTDVARKDYTSGFVVESILSHHGDKHRRSTQDFLVKWKGLDDTKNLYIPYSELNRNPILHQYLFDNKMKSLIFKEFRIGNLA